MADGSQAKLAMSHLDGQKLYGKLVYITLSKPQNMQLPCEGQEYQGLIKDRGSSPLYCFKKPASINYQNIFLPSASSTFCPLSKDNFKILFSGNAKIAKGFKVPEKERTARCL